ncbi:MAG: hypothetical protein RR646_08315 [Erysipelotrichaceae bacterium]
MKVFMIFMVLIPIIKDKQYNVSIKTCTTESIQVELNNDVIEIELFNINITKDGKEYLCRYLNEAKEHKKDIKIEVDNIKQELPLKVYLFIDNELVQSKLIDKDMATIKINNPEYKYIKEMNSKNTVVFNSSDEELLNTTKTGSRGYILIIFLLLLMSAIIIYLYKNKRLHS